MNTHHHHTLGLRLVALIVVAVLAAACERQSGEKDEQISTPPAATPQAPPAQPGVPPAAAAKPLTDLESLIAPIALYPDPLLAELLVASTYPLEVVQAAQWLDSNPDPATLSTKDWDASVVRLTEVPSVIKMMGDHQAWTTQLGDTFLATPDEVMAGIQALRQRATESGFLQDSPEQKVVKESVSATTQGAGVTPAVFQRETISIEPTKSDTIYVPQYSAEAAYSAPLAPPPATSAYPTTAGYTYPTAPAPSYYPTPATTSTTSNYNPALTFGAGALVGGLLTWGIMEWADDDDDWDDDYHVVHHYGSAVCREGECWRGGGSYGAGGYRGDINVDRGDITRNRNVNISGNEININRDRTFNQSDLTAIRQPTAWAHDPRHRRGERYPEAAKKRLGDVQQPALAGQRLGAAQTLPAGNRGFARPEARLDRPAAGGEPQRRPSSADVRERLAQQPGAKSPRAKPGEQRVSRDQAGARRSQGSRESVLEGRRSSGQQARVESQRGSQSRKIARAETRPTHDRAKAQSRDIKATKSSPRSGVAPASAFQGSRDARSTRSYSQRGAASRQHVASTGRSGKGGHRGGGGRRR